MATTPTPHNGAIKGDIAKTVLMPGDPLRAKFIADTYLQDVRCFNTVRNMLGYTGTYQGIPRLRHGRRHRACPPSALLLRLFQLLAASSPSSACGSAGGIADEVKVRDVVAGMGACTNSNYAHQYQLPGTYAPIASFDLLERAVAAGRDQGVELKVGNVLSSDTFYDDNDQATVSWQKMGVLAVEMEAAALYMNAARANKKALCLLTISDLPLKGESLSAEERQTSFTQMMEIALAVAIQE